MGDADQRAGIVEQVDEQEAEHDDDEGELGDAREIELQQGRRERRRQSNDAGELGVPERQADQRHDEDADQGAADDVAVVERHDEHEAQRGRGSPAIA